jgi:CRP-like cAMP-binding protein
VPASDGRATPVSADAAFVVVESGTVLLTAPDAAGRKAILSFARRGDLLVPPTAAEALIGLGGGTIRIVDTRTVAELAAIQGVAPRLIERLSAVIHDRQESFRLATTNPLLERLRAKLLQLAHSHGRVRPDGIRIALPLTHELLAHTVGASRETVSLAMGELDREGFVNRSGRSYLVRIHPRQLDISVLAAALSA